MLAYLAKIMLHFRQVRTVHHLPGRLRLHIPLLERLSPEWHRYQSELIALIKLKEGLLDIDVSFTSGRVLIRYDPRQTSKPDIMQWFKGVALMLYVGYLEAPFESKQQIAPFLKKRRTQAGDWFQRNHQIREIF
jgi:hypothetical protein